MAFSSNPRAAPEELRVTWVTIPVRHFVIMSGAVALPQTYALHR